MKLFLGIFRFLFHFQHTRERFIKNSTFTKIFKLFIDLLLLVATLFGVIILLKIQESNNNEVGKLIISILVGIITISIGIIVFINLIAKLTVAFRKDNPNRILDSVLGIIMLILLFSLIIGILIIILI